ncbi:hypothetical protein [Desulforamulus putei]|uniref:Uncharacterized protein n=1 Tax=Desulforamulus putei DSM 12395 TaxID=1121429 RepID=A0A1M4XGM7_9FIRM|nr:hypothetical protein SAMN02745133_01453 [Desulforamulus putei DSM 12395]
MGNLTGVLTLDDPAGEEELKTRLAGEFGANWQAMLLGKSQPFYYQLFNDVFLRVRDVEFADLGTVLSLVGKPLDVYNIIIG